VLYGNVSWHLFMVISGPVPIERLYDFYCSALFQSLKHLQTIVGGRDVSTDMIMTVCTLRLSAFVSIKYSNIRG
jgi:hypothetical protein